MIIPIASALAGLLHDIVSPWMSALPRLQVKPRLARNEFPRPRQAARVSARTCSATSRKHRARAGTRCRRLSPRAVRFCGCTSTCRPTRSACRGWPRFRLATRRSDTRMVSRGRMARPPHRRACGGAAPEHSAQVPTHSLCALCGAVSTTTV